MSADVQVSNQVVYVSGFIGFDNASSVCECGLSLIKQLSSADKIVVDLSGLTSSNTISLAVFVQWLRQSLPHKAVQLLHVPNKMHDIIGASSLLVDFGL